MTNVTADKGNDEEYVVTITDAGVPVDITGDKIYFTVKTLPTDDDVAAIIQKTVTSHTNPTAGETTISLDHHDTDIPAKEYYYDIRWITAAGGKVKTVMIGKFVVSQTVTAATT